MKDVVDEIVYINMYIYIYIYTCTYMYIYIERVKVASHHTTKYNAKPLYVIKLLYFGRKLPSSGMH